MDQSLHRFECLDAAHVLHGLHDDPTDQESPTVPVGGNGATVWDATGRRYLDGFSGPRNALLCHGRKELAEAAADQMRQLAFGCTYSGLAIAPAIQLAARLKGLASEELTATFFITRSGKSCPLGRGGNASPLGDHKGGRSSPLSDLRTRSGHQHRGPRTPIRDLRRTARRDGLDFATSHRGHDKCPLVVKTGGASGKTTEHPWDSAMRDLGLEVI